VDLQLLLPSVGVFLVIVCSGLCLTIVIKSYALKRVRDRLQDVILVGEASGGAAQAIILRDMQLSSIPLLDQILHGAKWAQKLNRLLVQAGIPMRLGTFVALMLFLGGLGGFLVGSIARQPIFVALPVALCLAWAPIAWARHKRQRRIRDFEKQFPDALDMLVSALRAGLAFTGAIQVVADESPDPLAQEFAILSEENRLGLDLREALKNMSERIESAELQLFVTAVTLQRTTGGNLAEVLEGTAAVIRDRFRILGEVRSLTAHARLTGTILALLPLGMAAIITVLAPDYLRRMAADPIGPYLIGAALSLQLIGFLIMRHIVNIKV
jgi:tight adherence protein B